MAPLKIGTRGSELARWQATTVATLLRSRAGVDSEIVIIRTTGDRLADATLSEIGGKRLFVKEIEDALLAGEIDLAVHSSKDMPAVLPDGLTIGAVLPREDARDAIVLPVRRATPPHRARAAGTPGSGSPGGPDKVRPTPRADTQATIEHIVRELGQQPRIGTSSIRRVAQLTRLFPGATFLPIRGNLDTRLRKLDSGDYDAIVLAVAGLRRLQQASRISAFLPADVCVPAPGQGIIAVEIREGDAAATAAVAHFNDWHAATALDAERAVVRALGGGCQMPIGAYATVDEHALTVHAVVISGDGARAETVTIDGRADEAEAAGRAAAEQLLEAGAGEILAEIQRQHATVEGLQP